MVTISLLIMAISLIIWAHYSLMKAAAKAALREYDEERNVQSNEQAENE